MTIPLQTSKVWLIPLSEADEALFVELYTTEKLMRKITDTFSASRAQRAFHSTLSLTLQSKPRMMSWVAKDKLTNTSLGIVGFSSIVYPHQADIGIILKREAHGKGIVVDIGNVLCDYVLTQVAISRVRAEFHCENLVIQKTVNKVGFGAAVPHATKANTFECYLTESPLDTK